MSKITSASGGSKVTHRYEPYRREVTNSQSHESEVVVVVTASPQKSVLVDSEVVSEVLTQSSSVEPNGVKMVSDVVVAATAVEIKSSLQCWFCGNIKDIQHHENVYDSVGSWGDFCRVGGCFKKYQAYVGDNCVNLTHGVPVKYFQKAAAATGRQSSRYLRPLPKKTPKGDLVCAYCGTKSSEVILNVGLEREYKHGNFCQNNRCCREYVYYVDNIKRIPHAFCVTGRR